MFAGGPDFVEKKIVGLIEGVVQVVLQTAFFFSRWANERADFRLQQKVLALFRAQQDDESDRLFGKFGIF